MPSSRNNNKAKYVLFKSKKKHKTEDEIIQELHAAYENIDLENVEKLEHFPLSEKTKKGLNKHNFIIPTAIQKASIGHSLRGEDILGAAKTGSGKTLAFLIPLLEVLYRKKWTKYDHVGAIVITPTRELAYQIFETLKKIGEFHDFSAGLIIGGKDLKFERKRMDQCNIVICTPGRLLQHMDENPLLDCSDLKLLILDEADRCLDMGFEKTMNSIVENLPVERQTLLFSATQTNSVKDLARLSLKSPKYISVDENAKYSTPSGLVQSYIQCDLHDKLNFLWSFIKNHRNQKSLIFLSSCKQVKYIYEVFCKMKPGVSLLALYGSLHQTKRMHVYNSFCQKQHVVLFATDIAARGLDFPSVNWVVQLDCPESANEYIHRAGRTARYQKAGESLLTLLPSEIKMLEHLYNKKIPIQEIQVNVKKLQNIQRNLEALLAKDTNLKESAQRSFVAYIKSVFLMKNKEIFDVNKLDTDAFARSLGLALSPRIRFIKKRQKHMKKQEEDQVEKNEVLIDKIRTSNNDDDVHCTREEKRSELKAKEMEEMKKTDIQKTTFNFYDDGDDDDDGFLYVKRRDHELDIQPISNPECNTSKKSKKPCTRAAIVKKMLKKKILPNKKIVFDEEGEAIKDKSKEYVSELAREYGRANEAGIDIEKAQMILQEEDKYDKQLFKERVRRKHHEEKRKIKQSLKVESESEDESDSLPYDSDEASSPGGGSNNSSDGAENDDSSEEEVEAQIPEPPKSTFNKKKRRKNSSFNLKHKRIKQYDDVAEDLSNLATEEELALQIMNFNK